MSYLTLKKAKEKLGLSGNTLRKYADQNKIESIRTPGGKRLFSVEKFLRSKEQSTRVCYCRVSSPKQRDDLQRQVEKMRELYPEAEVIKDVGSGLNFKRKGLRALLERLLQGGKLEIVVTHRDRLARFGFDLIEFLTNKNGGEIVVLDNFVSTSKSAELTADLLSILHHFSCRMHGSRSHKSQKNPNLSDERAETALSSVVRDFQIRIQRNSGAPEFREPGESLDESSPNDFEKLT